MEERLTAVLEGRSPLEGDLEAIADELGGLVDNALATASGLERAEDAADALGDELSEIQREASGAAASLAAVAGAAETLDATVSDVDLRDIDLSDVDLTFDTQNLDDILDSLERVPDKARTTRSALRALGESEVLSGLDVDRDPALGFDPETVQQRYSVAVDRTDLRSGLGRIDDRTVRVNPVLSALQEQNQQIEADIEADIDDLDISVGTSELSAAIAAVDTLEEHVDDLRSSLARLDSQRVSATVDADVATAIADLETVESKLNDIDGRRATLDVAVDAESVATDIDAVTDTTAVDADADLDIDTDTATLSVPADVSGTDNVRALSATVDEAGDVATEAAEGLGTFGRVSERVRQQTDRLADRTARLRSLLGGDLGGYGGLRETADEADRLAERIDALPDRVSRTIRLDVTDDIPGFESLGRRGFELDVDLPTDRLQEFADRLRSADGRVRSLRDRVRGFSLDAGFEGFRRRLRRATEAANEFELLGDTTDDTSRRVDRLRNGAARLGATLSGSLGEFGGLRETADDADRLADALDAVPDRISRTVRMDVSDTTPGFESLGREGFELDVDVPTTPIRRAADGFRRIDDRVQSVRSRVRDLSVDFDSVRRRARSVGDAVEEFARFDLGFDGVDLSGEYGGMRETRHEANRLLDTIEEFGQFDLGFEDFEIGYRFGEGDDAGFSDRVRRRLSRSIDGMSLPSLHLGRFLPNREDISDVETPDISRFAFGEESTQIGVEFETDGVAAAADDAAEVAEGVDEAAEAADVAADRLEQTEQQVKETTGRFEGLRAAMDVRGLIPDSITPSGFDRSSLGFGADSADVESQLGGASQVLRIGANIDIDDFQTAAEVADHLEANINQLGDSATATVAELHHLGESAEALVDDQVAAATTTHELADEVDDLGDESIEAAAGVGSLETSVGGLDNVGVNFGPFSTSVARLLPMLAPLAAGLFSVAGAAGAVGAGFGAIGGVGLGMLFGGLTSRAEELAAQSSEIEDASEGLEEIFSQFGQAAQNALEPLQTEEFEGFAMGALSGVLEILRDGAQFAADFSSELKPVLDRLGSQFWNTEPEFFAELGRTASATLPYLERFLSYLITAGPAALRWFREEGLETVDALGSFSVQAIDTAASLASVGNVLINTVVPGVTALAGAADWALETFRALPDPLEYAAIGAAVAAVAASGLAVALGSATTAAGALAAVLGVLSLPISGTTAAIAALVGATAGVISYFGAWGDIVGMLVGIYNGFIEYVEYSINLWLGLAQAIANAAMSFGFVASAVEMVGGLIDWLGGLLDWVVGKLKGVAEFVKDLAEAIGEVIDSVADATDEAGGVSLDEYKAGGDGDGEDGSDGGPGEPPDNPYAGRQLPGFNVTQPGSDGTVMGNAVASLPGTSPTATSGGGGSAATASTAGGSGTGARPTTGAAGMGGGTVNNYNYNVTVNATDLSRQEMKRVARQIHRKLERMDRKQTGPSAG